MWGESARLTALAYASTRKREELYFGAASDFGQLKSSTRPATGGKASPLTITLKNGDCVGDRTRLRPPGADNDGVIELITVIPCGILSMSVSPTSARFVRVALRLINEITDDEIVGRRMSKTTCSSEPVALRNLKLILPWSAFCSPTIDANAGRPW